MDKGAEGGEEVAQGVVVCPPPHPVEWPKRREKKSPSLKKKLYASPPV